MIIQPALSFRSRLRCTFAAVLFAAATGCGGGHSASPPTGSGGDGGVDLRAGGDGRSDSSGGADRAGGDALAADSGGDTGADAGPADGGSDGAAGGRCPVLRLGTTLQTRDAILADVDGNGWLDVVTVQYDGHVAVFRQLAARSFADPDVYDVALSYEEAVAAGDLDEDGALDLAISDDYGRVGLLLSGGGAGLAPRIVPGPASQIFSDIVVADLDGDGHRDVAVPAYEAGTVGIWWASGGGALLPRVDQPVCTSPVRLEVLDANEDGRPDLAVGCYNSAARLMINGGARTFTSSPLSTTSAVQGFAVGDINHDGHADLVMLDRAFDHVVVLLGDGHGQFSVPTGLISATTPEPEAAALGDFDADGNIDLAIGDGSLYQVFFYRGSGDGYFQAPQAIPISATAFNLTAGDVDRDGTADLVVTEYGAGASIFFGPCP